MPKQKIDIKKLLSAIDEGDVSFVRDMSAEDKKQINPFVILHWLMSTADRDHAILINEALNVPFMSVSLDLDRFLRVAMACRPAKSQRYKWLSKFPKKDTSMPQSIIVLMKYYGIGEDDSRKSIGLYTLDNILDMAYELGYEDSEIKAVRKEWRNV